MMKKILFITGTRADYGKIKSLIKRVEDAEQFEAYIFVSGMHLIEKFGSTYKEVLKDGYKNVYIDFSQLNMGNMSFDLGNVICNLTGYVKHIIPDMIVVHGDRIDALAGAIVGALNNILVAHIEGGELSGTIDESTRHAISKFSHLHLVCNENAKNRLVQLGEEDNRIHIIGSPDIDIMLSCNLPTLSETKERYGINFEKYAILMFHPVTTEHNTMKKQIQILISAIKASKINCVVVYPNNDFGSEIILSAYEELLDDVHFKVFPSLRFEYFLTLLKNTKFIIGNSSAGVREAGVYGVPAIDIGSRQSGRYSLKNSNIQHVNSDYDELVNAIKKIDNYRIVNTPYGMGNSTDKFMNIIQDPKTWELHLQKKFVDFNMDFY